MRVFFTFPLKKSATKFTCNFRSHYLPAILSAGPAVYLHDIEWPQSDIQCYPLNAGQSVCMILILNSAQTRLDAVPTCAIIKTRGNRKTVSRFGQMTASAARLRAVILFPVLFCTESADKLLRRCNPSCTPPPFWLIPMDPFKVWLTAFTCSSCCLILSFLLLYVNLFLVLAFVL